MGVTEADAIRPFSFEAPESDLADLRKRIKATKWPEREQVADELTGREARHDLEAGALLGNRTRLAKVRSETECTAAVRTEIEGLDIHFIHARSKHEDALPMIVTHGWPGSIIEQLKIIEPLINPTAHGGSAADAFHLVISSLPGYGFSGKPATPGAIRSASPRHGRRSCSASVTQSTWRREATGATP